MEALHSNLSKLWIFLAPLVELVSFASGVLSIPIEHVYEAATLTDNVVGVRDVAIVGDGQYVLVSGGGKPWDARQLRVTTESQETLLSIMEGLPQSCTGEALLGRNDGGWWYSHCGGTPGEFLVHFISSDASSTPTVTRLALGSRSVKLWLPVVGDEPSGVLLASSDTGELHLLAYLIAPGTTVELASFTGGEYLGVERWQAVRLADERIALVSIEQDDRGNRSDVVLRVFSKGGVVVESRLQFEQHVQYAFVAAAVSEAGELAVVAARDDRVVVGMTIDADAPQLGRPRILSNVEGAALPFPGVVVASSGDRFVVSWVGASDRAVWLSELTPSFTYPAFRIGEGSDRYHPVLALRHRSDGIDVCWVGIEGLTWRRLPEKPTGYFLAAGLWKRMWRAVDNALAPHVPTHF